VRRKIRRLTQEYLDWADFEANAATLSETTARVHTIKVRLANFENPSSSVLPKFGKEADYYARSLISKHMGLPFEGRDGLQNLALKIERDIARGCTLDVRTASAYVRKQAGNFFRES